jgi:D-alanine-D-alanine ligase
MQKIRVGIVRGGPSSEYDVSLKTGQTVLRHLPEKYIPVDILIDKAGQWYKDGWQAKPEDVFRNVDVVFNALHGEYGEDGKIQQLMDHFGVSYTGSNALASAIGMNKLQTKNIFKQNKIKTPAHALFRKDDGPIPDLARSVFRLLPLPLIVKPVDRGSSVGVSKVMSFAEIVPALEKAFGFSDTVLVEEFIKGREATCGVIDNFRDQNIYPLLPIEIIPPEKSFFDYKSKYGGETQEICPGNFSKEEKRILQDLAVNVHQALGLRHYSRTDFIVSPKRGIYVLEVNTLPGLTEQSLMPKSLEAIGSNLSHFIDHIIKLAVLKK